MRQRCFPHARLESLHGLLEPGVLPGPCSVPGECGTCWGLMLTRGIRGLMLGWGWWRPNYSFRPG